MTGNPSPSFTHDKGEAMKLEKWRYPRELLGKTLAYALRLEHNVDGCDSWGDIVNSLSQLRGMLDDAADAADADCDCCRGEEWERVIPRVTDSPFCTAQPGAILRRLADLLDTLAGDDLPTYE